MRKRPRYQSARPLCSNTCTNKRKQINRSSSSSNNSSMNIHFAWEPMPLWTWWLENGKKANASCTSCRVAFWCWTALLTATTRPVTIWFRTNCKTLSTNSMVVLNLWQYRPWELSVAAECERPLAPEIGRCWRMKAWCILEYWRIFVNRVCMYHRHCRRDTVRCWGLGGDSVLTSVVSLLSYHFSWKETSYYFL